MDDRNIPPICPSCGEPLVVAKLECPACSSEVTGCFDLCPVCRLDDETRVLFDLFMSARGNLKEMQRQLGVSYPTVRQRIEEMFLQLGYRPLPTDPKTILGELRSGAISVDEAERLLRGI